MRSLLSLSILTAICGFAVPAYAQLEALPCVLDDGLSEVAAEIALSGGGDANAQSTMSIARGLGVDAPFLRVRRFAATDSRAARSFVEEERERADAPVACGEARGTDSRVIVTTFRGGALVPQERGFTAQLAPRFRDAHIVLRAHDGAMSRHSLPASRLVTVPRELARPVTVQLVATGPAGPRPVAVRLVGARGEAPAMEIDAGDDPGRFLSAVRAFREVSPIRDNRLLRAAAQRHARRVCRAGRALHQLGGSDPEDRLRDEGITARVVGEVVARSRTVEGALRAFFHSPSHLMTLVDRRFTDYGAGVARGRDGRSCVVLTFAAWPRYIGH